MLEPTDAGILVFDDANTDKTLEVLERTEIELGVHADEQSIDREDVEPSVRTRT